MGMSFIVRIVILGFISSTLVFASIYVEPNEMHLNIGEEIYRRSNHGVYLSVGTERSFMGAAYTRAEALYVIDIDPDIIQFTRINRALLSASSNRTEYVYLRTKATVKDWTEKAKSAVGETKSILEDSKSWTFWNTEVLQANFWGGFRELLKMPVKVQDSFYGFNYLFDDALYSHLKKLVEQGRIWVSAADLTIKSQMQPVLDKIQNEGLELGIIDTSNVPQWVLYEKAASYYEYINTYCDDGAIFLATSDRQIGTPPSWNYFAYTSKYLNSLSHDKLVHLLRSQYPAEKTKYMATLDEKSLPVPF